MKLILYHNASDRNVINKELTEIETRTITLKKDTDLDRLQLFIHKIPSSVNYLYLELINKYYFIDSTKSVNNNMIELICSIDVLESYKTEILNSDVMITLSQEKSYFKTIPDNKTTQERKIVSLDLSEKLEPETNLIISTIGGL